MKCITPSRALTPADRTERLKSVPTAEEVGKLSTLELLTSENVKASALLQIIVQDLIKLNPINSKILVPCTQIYCRCLLNACNHKRTFPECSRDSKME
ncbi:hypothetical protein AVEN_67680-1 [Araneus ventricosus]|uniref:Uncharacterized protein n=1 Tax=Araneus ventricosus TaxID=182803 RepID=A0A4Y2S5T8_ARAVE|nr:hypothetical protein AVEN_67680-1 [Araneus ventricosus]